MTLIPGSKLGPYEVLAQIGAGGMGEVYKAKDLRLDRFVAIKVLPEHLAKNGEALARFEREAKAVAALNHPNITGLFDIGQEGDSAYAVMELLEGESLRARLQQGALTPRAAVQLATQLAQGLAAAHDRGVVHRDLKPENLWVTPDGRLKILDFGLAKQVAPMGRGSESFLATEAVSPPVNARVARDLGAGLVHQTEAGMILGTIGYMSPEQVRGDAVDARSDIFAFGVVLFELLSGLRPFQGDTAVQTMAAILEQDPPELSTSRGPLPQGLEGILGHCLEKRPEARFQSMKDIAFDLQNLGSGSLPAAVRGLPGSGRQASWQTSLTGAGAMVVLGLLLGFAGLLHLGSPVPLPTFKRLTYFRGTLERATFANHGQTVLYSALVDGQPSSLYSLSRGAAEPTRMGQPGTYLLSVSSENELLVLRNTRYWGGRTVGTLAQANPAGAGLREVGESVYQADWTPDGQAFAVVRISDRGTSSHQIEFPLGTVVHQSVGRIGNLRVSPDGKRLLFVESTWSPGAPLLVQVLTLGGKVATVASGTSVGSVIWGASGRDLWLAELEGDQTTLSKLSLSGSRKTLWRGAGSFELQGTDAEGRLLLSLHQVEAQVETAGAESRFPRNLSWLNSTQAFAFSPDGQTLFFNESNPGLGNLGGIYQRKAEDPAPVRLGSGSGCDVSPDGRWVLGASPEGQFLLLPTGAGAVRKLDTGPGIGAAGWFFPDGRRILLDKTLPDGATQMVIHDLEHHTNQPAAPQSYTCFTGQRPISPDGGRMALYYRDPKTTEVSVWIFPVTGEGKTRVPGLGPRERVLNWTLDGRGLYVFERGNLPAKMDEVDVATGRRKPWKSFMPADPAGIRGIANLEMTPDGRHVAFNYERILTQLFLVEGLK